MNEKKCLVTLNCPSLHYYVNIHKQAELTKNIGLDSSNVYRRASDHDQRTSNHLLLHNISWNERNQAFCSYTCM